MEPLPVPIHPVAAAIPIPTIPPSLLPTAMGILAPAALPSENVPQATLPHQPSPAPASAQGLPFHGPPAMPDPSQGPQAPTEAVIQAQPQLGSILSDQPQGPAAPTAEAVENFESHPILPEEVAEAKVEMEFPEQPAADLEPQAAAAAKDPVPSAPSAPLTYAERVRLSLASKAAAAQAAQHPASAPSGPPLAAPVPAAPEGAPSLKDSKQPPPLENGSMPAVAVPAAAHPASLAQPQSSSPNASVFVRYLPAGVNEEVLAAELERFGPLQPSNMYPKVV